MAKLDAAARHALPASEFALPGGRYPIPDRSHAIDAKGRATQQENAGNLSPGEAATVRRKADSVLGQHHEKMADHHLALHANHSGLSDHHAAAGDREGAKLHHSIAHHHMKVAEQHDAMRDFHESGTNPKSHTEREEDRRAKQDQKDDPPVLTSMGTMAKPAGPAAGLIKGAATQLHAAGHITTEHKDRIHKSPVGPKPPRAKPFGSLAGAGHYIGDVPSSNSPGTNSGGDAGGSY
jgi:hypothetical protein